MTHYYINRSRSTKGNSRADGKLGLRSYYTLTALVGVLLLWSVGCSDTPSQPESADTPNNSAEFGGYTATSEQPAFGSPEFASIETEAAGVEVSDPILATAEVMDMERDPEARSYAVRIQWGRLDFDSTVTTVTDWSGSLSLNRGAEVVRRVIHFERGQDELLPRTDRRLIEWKSLTTVHNDGLLVEIFNPRRPDSIRLDTTLVKIIDTSIVDGDTMIVDRD